MSEKELIPLLIYMGGALVFALILVAVQAAFLEFELRMGRWLLPLIMPLLLLGIGFSTLLAGRSLKYAAMNIGGIGSNAGGGDNLMRMITALVLAISISKIVRALFSVTSVAKLENSAEPGVSKFVFVSFLAFFFCTVIFPSALGAHPTFVHNAVYPVILFSAAYFSRKEPIELLIQWAKTGLFIFLFCSLALALIKPDMVLQPAYQGWVPALNVRLWGLGAHANSIGPLALFLILLQVLRPSPNRGFGLLIWFTALIVLVLAQSKTVWLSGILVALIIAAYRGGREPGGGIKPSFMLGLIGLMLLACLSLLFVDIDRLLLKLSLTQAGSDISTLTGRSSIWAVAMQVFAASPVFGYGLEAWGPAHRIQIGMPFAFHAHNQLLQTMSVAGAVGGLSLLVYFFAILKAAWRAAPRTGGVSLGLVLFIAIRCVGEAPLELTGFFVGELVLHFFLFALLVHEPAQKREGCQ
ncbi:O-antigen ligase family protein [Paucibacter sp. KCTC 42545]|uniref:O-antigen ligase family protein n=1 Tax=Paucibacter sp. KCTC 42545 TaxID=1768242 RepID=UPI000733BA30|nr:O-antigen ligase family protein [Paucibacter sp. KCTC 42545]ALT78068.1 hypothetical protein AT984_13625 [Paucibacter sp. KCTC 42545]